MKSIKCLKKDKKKDKKANENLGLNPSHEGETDPEKIAEKNHQPIYLTF